MERTILSKLQSKGITPKTTCRGMRLGRHVETLDGRGGIVRYIGQTLFGHNAKMTIWVGIELDKPFTGKHSGIVDGIRYFRCPKNRGVFVSVEKIDYSKPIVLAQSKKFPDIPQSYFFGNTFGLSKQRLNFLNQLQNDNKNIYYYKQHPYSIVFSLILQNWVRQYNNQNMNNHVTHSDSICNDETMHMQQDNCNSTVNITNNSNNIRSMQSINKDMIDLLHKFVVIPSFDEFEISKDKALKYHFEKDHDFEDYVVTREIWIDPMKARVSITDYGWSDSDWGSLYGRSGSCDNFSEWNTIVEYQLCHWNIKVFDYLNMNAKQFNKIQDEERYAPSNVKNIDDYNISYLLIKPYNLYDIYKQRFLKIYKKYNKDKIDKVDQICQKILDSDKITDTFANTYFKICQKYKVPKREQYPIFDQRMHRNDGKFCQRLKFYRDKNTNTIDKVIWQYLQISPFEYKLPPESRPWVWINYVVFDK